VQAIAEGVRSPRSAPPPLPASARHLPGPGAYRTPPGVGKQTLSVKATLPVVSFGKGSREALTKKVGRAGTGPGSHA
jgi:hypothetical protein